NTLTATSAGLSGSPLTFTATGINGPSNPVPATTSLSPSHKPAGAAGFVLTVNGSDFISTSVVNFNGSARTTTYISSTKVTAGIPSTDLTAAGAFPITVFNPGPG